MTASSRPSLGLALALLLTAGAQAALPGRLLFVDTSDYLATSSLDGQRGKRLTEAPLGKNTTITVLDRGRRYALYRPQPGGRTTTVSMHDMASGALEFTQQVPVNSFIVGPIFGNPELFLLRTVIGDDDGHKAFVVHLRSGQLLKILSTQGLKDTIEVLPDGRLYRIHGKTGRIAVAGADGAWRDIGTLQVPAGLEIAQWRLNHRGDRLAVVYGRMNELKLLRSDVWIANIDGSGQHRLTNQWDMLGPHWSPDDRYVAFQFDTSSWLVSPGGLGGAGTYGHCSYWAVPAEARDVADISYKRAHPVATQLYAQRDGLTEADVCRFLDWLP